MSEAREIAEHELEMAIKDVLSDEFEACWNRLKEDATISDPAEQMNELAEWFAEQVQTTISEIIEQDPVEEDEYEPSEDGDDLKTMKMITTTSLNT